MTQYPRAKGVKSDVRMKASIVLAEQNPHLDERVCTCGREEEGKVEIMRKFAHFERYWYRGYVIPQNDIKSYLCSKCCT